MLLQKPWYATYHQVTEVAVVEFHLDLQEKSCIRIQSINKECTKIRNLKGQNDKNIKIYLCMLQQRNEVQTLSQL
jgi:hypothetical protein